MNKIKRADYVFIIIGIFAVITAIYFYSFGRPFWIDESALALNCIGRNNFFTMLSHQQAAPPLFLHLAKIFYYLPVKAEYSLRIVPLVSYIVALPLMYALINKIFKNTHSKIIAFILFAFNYRVLYYAEEFKQYSSDVFIFLLIITSYLYIDSQKITKNQKIVYGALLAISLWFSNAAAIAIAGIGIIYLYKLYKKECTFKDYTIVFLPSLLSVCAYYFIMQSTVYSEDLHNYWQDSFLFSSGYYNFLKVMNRNAKFYFTSNYYIPAFIILLGFIKSILERKFIIVVPVLILMIISSMKLYPFSERLILFLFPFIAIYIADICDYKNKIASNVLTIIVALSVVIPNTLYSIEQIYSKTYYYEDIYTPLKTAKKLMENGDKLLIDDSEGWSFRYYNKYFKFKRKNFILLSRNINEVIVEIEKLPSGNYYYIFSHNNKKSEWFKYMDAYLKKYKNYKVYADEHENALFIFSK